MQREFDKFDIALPQWYTEDILSHKQQEGHRPSACVTADYPYRIVRQSSSFTELYGFGTKEITRSSLRVIFGPETDKDKLKATIGNAYQNQVSAESFTFYKKNGDSIVCSVTGCPITIDGCVYSGLEFEVLNLMGGNDTAQAGFSASCKRATEFPPQKTKSVKEFTFADPSRSDAGYMCSQFPDAPEAMDPAVLLHIKAVKKAAMRQRDSHT